MPIIEERFIPSKKNYAINWDSFKKIRDNSYSVDAIWAFKKKGELYVSSGRITTYDINELTIEDFKESFDSRYGGSPTCTWDGVYMTTQQTIPLDEMVELSKTLDPILANLPEIPDGYDGWYRLT